MIHPKMIEAIVDGVIPAVKEYTDKSIAPFVAKLSELEVRAPEKGEPGQPGTDGKSVDVAEIQKLIAAEVAHAVLDLPKPKDGESGTDGKSVTLDDVRPIIEELVAKIPLAKDGKDVDPAVIAALISAEVEKAAAALPKPADGKSVTVEDIVPMILLAVSEAVAKIPPAENGKDADPETVAALVTTEVEKAVAALPKPIDGKDADPILIKEFIESAVAGLPVPKDGAAGRDGLQADECLVPDDLAVDVGKAIALLHESPPITPKQSPVVVNVPAAVAQSFKAKKITRDKTDGSLTITEQAE